MGAGIIIPKATPLPGLLARLPNVRSTLGCLKAGAVLRPAVQHLHPWKRPCVQP